MWQIVSLPQGKTLRTSKIFNFQLSIAVVEIYQRWFEFSLRDLSRFRIWLMKWKQQLERTHRKEIKNLLNSSRMKTPFFVKHFLMWSKRTKNWIGRMKQRNQKLNKVRLGGDVFWDRYTVMIYVWIWARVNWFFLISDVSAQKFNNAK